jgi:hypothetical protein
LPCARVFHFPAPRLCTIPTHPLRKVIKWKFNGKVMFFCPSAKLFHVQTLQFRIDDADLRLILVSAPMKRSLHEVKVKYQSPLSSCLYSAQRLRLFGNRVLKRIKWWEAREKLHNEELHN